MIRYATMYTKIIERSIYNRSNMNASLIEIPVIWFEVKPSSVCSLPCICLSFVFKSLVCKNRNRVDEMAISATSSLVLKPKTIINGEVTSRSSARVNQPVSDVCVGCLGGCGFVIHRSLSGSGVLCVMSVAFGFSANMVLRKFVMRGFIICLCNRKSWD